VPHNKKLRRNPSGHIWQMRVNIPGRGQREFTTGETDYAEALKVLQRKEAEIADGARPSRAATRFTLAVATEMLKIDYELHERKSLDTALRKIGHLTAYFGAQRKLATIDSAAWVLYMSARKRAGASKGEINLEQAYLHRLFVLGRDARLLTVVPKLQTLVNHNRRTGFYEHSDFIRVRRQLARDLRPIFDLIYYSGWRGAEARDVLLRQVTEDGMIRLDPADSKEQSGKALPYTLIPALRRSIGYVLREHARLQAEGIVCTQLFVRWTGGCGAERGDPIVDWRGAYNAARARAGVTRNLHDCRRTAARTLSKLGFDESTGMKVTGHKTAVMWHHYNIRAEADVRAAFEAAEGDIQRAVRGSFRGSRLIRGGSKGQPPVRIQVVSRGKPKA